MDENDKKIKKLESLLQMIDESLTREEFINSFEKVLDIVKAIKAKNEEELEKIRDNVTLLSDTEKKDLNEHIDGLKLEANKLFAEFFKLAEEKVASIKKVLNVKNGKDGKDADEQKIIDSLLVKIKVPTLEEIQNNLPALGEKFRDALELLTGEERLDISAIKGLDKFFKDLDEKIQGVAGSGVRTGWGAHPLVIQDDGDVVDKMARVLNFKGTAITSIVRNPDGTIDITINGGGAGTVSWGDIIGTLSDQLDLQAALDLKVDESLAIAYAVAL